MERYSVPIPTAFKRIGKCIVSLATKALAPHNNCDAGKQADGDAAGRADPVVVEGEFQEIRNPYQERGDPDAIEPVRAYAGFEIDLGLDVGEAEGRAGIEV